MKRYTPIRMTFSLFLALILAPLTAAPVAAQEAAPATVVLPTDRTVLPIPEPQYPHSTVFNVRNATPPPRFEVKAPAKAPNVLIVLIDDMGFGQSSAFGGPIHMPTVEQLANDGLRYNEFHTTALCSPTRIALLTGRNHHMNNMGGITELATAFPGNNGQRPNSVTPLAEMLRLNGYATSAFGKSHETAAWELSVSGPTDRWPTRSGFDKFYGFIAAEANQWTPALYEDMTPIEPPHDPMYHFMTDMTNHAIAWVQAEKSLTPDKPFFMYFAPGATHAPHHVPKEWIAKYRGQFDQGWDKLREETFARQKTLGVIPQDTILTPRPANMPAWDSLDARQKELFARMAEIYAAFLAYDDYNIGRVIESVKQEGLSENTLIIFIEGDNGGSAEGTLQGTANEVCVVGNGATESFDYLYSIKDELGGPLHYNHMPVPWSWAFDTPFQWTKRYASHFGGTRNGMVMSWPKRIKDVGTLREQFHYVTDILPTILEAAGVQAPDMINGAKQLPIDGISMAYTWEYAKAPTRRATQLFEMFGNRGIYHDGWMASTTPLVFAWEREPKGITPESFNWELYDLTRDFSQGADLAKAMPEKLKQMEELWWAEAGRNNALPLNFSPQATVEAVFQKPSLTRGRSHLCLPAGHGSNP